MPIPSAPEVCSSVELIPDVDLQPIQAWWDIDESVFSTFDDYLNMRVLVEGFSDKGIFKKKDLDAKSIREYLRIFYKNGSDSPVYILKKMYKYGKKGSKNPCDTYLLLTEDNSSFDAETEKDEIKTKTKVSELPEETQKQRTEKKEKSKKTKAELKKTILPKKVEGKPKKVEVAPKKVEVAPKKVEGKTKEVIKLETERYAELNKTLERLEKQYEKGLLTKKEWLKRQDIILNKFESGGIA
jgi:hypothetical protein